MRMTELKVRLDWTAARAVPILVAAQRLGAAPPSDDVIELRQVQRLRSSRLR